MSEAGVHPEANRVNQIVDRVNTTATVFMGVTLECAQCHDHKYDPFTQKDYYQLFAYFNNSPLEVKKTEGVTWDFYGPTLDLPVDDQALQQHQALKQQISVLQQQLTQLQQTTNADASKISELKTQLENLESASESLRTRHHTGDGGNAATSRDVRFHERRLRAAR